MSKSSQRQKGIIGLILLAFTFALHGLFPRFLSEGFELFEQVYLRMLVALVLGCVVFYKHISFKKMLHAPFRDLVLLFLRAFAMFVGGIVLSSQALILAKYSNVSFIGAIPATAILGAILLREKVTPPKILLVLLAFVGVVLIAVQDYSHIFEWGTGELLALASAFAFSLSYVLRKWQTDYLNNQEMTQVIFFFGVIILIIGSFFRGETVSLSDWSPALLLAILITGLLNVVSLFLMNYSFERVDAFLGNNILTLSPLFALILGFFVFGETPIAKELIGGFLIVLSVIIMNRYEKYKPSKKR
jgi:drug/metabolite transporter (DMT)-like permease